jgi:uncharacterized protein YhjY with autotransporter beta-barrel domain
MAAFEYKDSRVRAAVYYKHPSGQRSRAARSVVYEVDEQEYAHLQEAFSAFERGENNKKAYTLRLNNQKETTIRLDEISSILHEAREIVLN